MFPISIALIEKNGFKPSSIFFIAGLFYLISSIYFKITMPVQPLKAMSAIAIAHRLNYKIINAAGLVMGIFLIFLSITNLAKKIGKIFPLSIIRGIQLGVGLILIKTGISMINSQINIFFISIVLLIISFVFLKNFPFILPILVLGFVLAFQGVENLNFNFSFPKINIFNLKEIWDGFFILFIPQIALTVGNACVATEDTAKILYGERAKKVNLKSLSFSMGIANILSSFFAGVPMCHGSSGVTAHFKAGSRDKNSGLIIGFALIIISIFFESSSLNLFSNFPSSILGILLCYTGFQHSVLIKDILSKKKELIICFSVSLPGFFLNNLTYGFVFGFLALLFFKAFKRVL